jgi:hypothetical protein
VGLRWSFPVEENRKMQFCLTGQRFGITRREQFASKESEGASVCNWPCAIARGGDNVTLTS